MQAPCTMGSVEPQTETDTYRFLKLLYSGIESRYIACWQKPNNNKLFLTSELDQVAQHLRSEPNIYYRVSLLDRRPTSGRGDATYTGTVVAFVADFDIHNPTNPNSHKAPKEELPHTVDEVLDFVASLALKPSLVVHSGNGIHVYWVLKHPLDVTPYGIRDAVGGLMGEWQSYVMTTAKRERGWKVDNVGDLPRVLRAPGTINEKEGQQTIVRLIRETDARYGLEDFKSALPEVTKPAPTSTATSKRSARVAADNSDETLDHAAIMDDCAWFRHCFEDAATLAEDQWYAAFSIVAHCTDSESVAHDMSKDYPGYDAAETSKKLAHAKSASGPRTCANIEGKLQSPYCATCPHRGKIRSPAVLGRPEAELTRAYGYLLPTQQFVHYATGGKLTKDQFNDKYFAEQVRRGRKNTPAKYLLSRSTLGVFDNIEYRPGQSAINDNTYNTWKRGGPLPEAGDASVFQEHLEFIFPDEDCRKHFIRWLAHSIQHPERRIKHVILLIGDHGVGKSYFTSYLLRQLVGRHNVSCIGPEDIKGQWTDWLAEKQFVVVEELMAFGQLDTSNKLKPLITQETVRVNQKNVAHYEVTNTANFICTSNHDSPIKLEPGDRRWFVYKSPARARDSAYYDQLFTWTEQNLGVIAQYLMSLDLAGFNTDAPPPMTPAKAALIEVSREPLERLLREMIAANEKPFWSGDLVLLRDVTLEVQRKGYGKYNEMDVARVLPKVGFTKLEREKKATKDGVRVSLRPWCRANHEHWEQASGQECSDELSRGRSG